MQQHQEQYPEHIDALATLISQHVNIVRMREERERNIKKRLTWLADFVERAEDAVRLSSASRLIE